MFAPQPFCVDDNPPLTVCTRIAYPRCEPTSRASYSIVFFGVSHSGIRDSVLTAIHRVFSHAGAIHVVVGHRARAHTHPYLNPQEGPSTHPDDLLQRRRPFPYRTSFIAPLRTHRHGARAAAPAPATTTTAVWGHHAVVPPLDPRTATADTAQAQAEADRSAQNEQGRLRVVAHCARARGTSNTESKAIQSRPQP
ncbi:hypothetical protein B0H14DRAFT_3493183 [Mycena olivaceomarginata]|nr:hypothetical protein B0H14DRAFT_3493183 [Mycena olivaceomarginata]